MGQLQCLSQAGKVSLVSTGGLEMFSSLDKGRPESRGAGLTRLRSGCGTNSIRVRASRATKADQLKSSRSGGIDGSVKGRVLAYYVHAAVVERVQERLPGHPLLVHQMMKDAVDCCREWLSRSCKIDWHSWSCKHNMQKPTKAPHPRNTALLSRVTGQYNDVADALREFEMSTEDKDQPSSQTGPAR